MISRSTDIRGALRARQRGFLLNPFRFGAGGGSVPFSAHQLLLHGNGTNGSTSLVDSSSYARTVTVGSSSYAVISTTQSKFGGSSIFFPGTVGTGPHTTGSAGCTYTTPAGADFGLGAYTIQAWVYPTALTSNSGSQITIWSSISNESPYRGARLYINSTGSLQWESTSDITGDGVTSATGLITANAWWHLAVSCGGSGGNQKLFINGTEVATSNLTGGTNGIRQPALNPFICIGCTEGGNWRMKGYIDDLQVTKGYQLFTASFTAPTAELPDS